MTPTVQLMLAGVALLLLSGLRLFLAWRSRRWIIGKRSEDTVVVRRRGRFMELVFVGATSELVQSRQDRSNELSSGG